MDMSRKLDNTFGGTRVGVDHSKIIEPANDTKMTDNEAFQAFLSKGGQNSDGEISDY